MTPDQVRAELGGELPPSVLVLGRGAGELVFRACSDRGWEFRWDVNAEAARQVLAEAALAPLRDLRVIALSLDGASEQVQNMLLKVLEEPSADTRFILAATARPLPTVVSRSRVLVLGHEAREVPAASTQDKAVVAAAVRAARSRQPLVLAQAVREWKPEHHRLLEAWATEAATGRWARFSADLAPGVTPDQALRLLAELTRRAGSKLAPVVALDLVFSQRSD
jgi:hypothetical protein